jgi:hypothetical protein
MAAIKRADSQYQDTVDWLNPRNQSILETTVEYEKVAVDLTANLAKMNPKITSDKSSTMLLLEEFDHPY